MISRSQIAIVVILLVGVPAIFGGQVLAWDETMEPVVCMHQMWMDLGKGSVYFDETTGPEKSAYVLSRVVDGEVLSSSWVESVQIFRKAYMLSTAAATDSQEGRRWRDIAFGAARRCFCQKPEAVMLMALCVWKLDAWGIAAADREFCARLAELVEAQVREFGHPAVAWYTLSLLEEAAGDPGAAKAAMEEAYACSPDDAIVRHRTMALRLRYGDYFGAEQLVRRGVAASSSEGIWAVVGKANRAYEIGEVMLAKGDLIGAGAAFAQGWALGEELLRLREQRQMVIVPAAELTLHRCATGLGLVCLAQGDVEGARLWLSASLTPHPFLDALGYDLRLVAALVDRGEAQRECMAFLRAVSSAGPPRRAQEATALLERLDSGPGASYPGDTERSIGRG